ncbi:MAG: hypothetical protein ACI8X5_002681 [Planctomycetota bacterium]|jgi:hypothetical protein
MGDITIDAIASGIFAYGKPAFGLATVGLVSFSGLGVGLFIWSAIGPGVTSWSAISIGEVDVAVGYFASGASPSVTYGAGGSTTAAHNLQDESGDLGMVRVFKKALPSVLDWFA